MAERTRRLFVAGATGATGRRFVLLARNAGVEVVPHARPRSLAKAPAGAALFDLGDRAALVGALRSCSTVVQLIGTMRSRFAQGDTYAASDVGTTKQLVDAAREAGCDHVVLLSSVGAGKPRGAYLRAKAEAEALVTGSGLGFTLFRPSFLEGEDRHPPPLAGAVTRLFGLKRFQPITIDDLCAAMLKACIDRAPLGVALEGASLWEQVAKARAKA